ncbi:hypothetical protein AAG747_28160 [Rapidithrix thailandica]|uniref:Lipoprotein n=1 Tax=Rapidithrix thailandica TaxID=413964 RepID=A0AAW9SL16_9BACT
MKKLGILLCLALCISACHRRIQTFYAYEDEHSYCTLETRMKKDDTFRSVIYRAMSKTHYDTVQAPVTGGLEPQPLSGHPRKNNLYLYIMTGEGAFDDRIGISDVVYGFYYIKRERGLKFDFCFPGPPGEKENKMRVRYKKVTNDSLIISRPSELENYCFSHLGIDWFPPYMKRVKEIDYDKFRLPQVKNKHLKNPTKALLTDEDFEKIENTERSQKQ